jgi:hypothetical protein
VDRSRVAGARVQWWAFVDEGAIEDGYVFHHPDMVLLSSQDRPCPVLLLNLYGINSFREDKFALINIKGNI